MTDGSVALGRHPLPVARIEIGLVDGRKHLHARIMFRVNQMFCEDGAVLSPLVVVLRDEEPVACLSSRHPGIDRRSPKDECHLCACFLGEVELLVQCLHLGGGEIQCSPVGRIGVVVVVYRLEPL